MEEKPELLISEQEVQIPSPSFLDKLKIHKFKILGGILGVLVFSGAVFGAYKFGQRQIQPGPQPPPTSVAVATPTPDPTVNWKTYTNEKYRYSIRYPVDRYLSPQVDVGIERSPEVLHELCFVYVKSEGGCEIELLITQKSITDYLKEHTGDGSYRHITKEYTLAGNEATLVEYQSIARNEIVFVEVLAKKGTYLFALNTTAGSQYPYEKIFNLMLSTFRFLPSTSSGQGE